MAYFGIPLRVKSDQRLEHVSVADFMLFERGDRSKITGPSTHNQRIERFWRDIFEGVLSFVTTCFIIWRTSEFFNPLNMEYLAALHCVYMDEINRGLNFLTTAWS